MKGYFAIGVEGVNKPQNLGTLLRSAFAFDASFFFAVNPELLMKDVRFSDTAKSYTQVPFYMYEKLEDMKLPQGCQLVGVELVDDSVELPSFCHPKMAAYILGPEGGSLSQATLDKCDHVIKIPTKFCVNVGIAGAIVMYDRLIHLGRFPARPVVPGGKIIPLPEPQHGTLMYTKKNKKKT